MFKRCMYSFLVNMGIVSIVFIIISLILPELTQIKFLYLMVCVITPIHFFGFITLELKLFSSYLCIRRAIIISFSSFVMIAVSYLFGYLRFETNSLVAYGISISLYIVSSVFAYYVADKIEQQNLKLINQKLAHKNSENIEKN